MAVFLSNLGMHVDIYEKRTNPNNPQCAQSFNGIEDEMSNSEFGSSASAVKRSINLALSHRGILAMDEVGLVDTILKNAVQMPRRVIHTVNKPEMEQSYGGKGDNLWSISRHTINDLLLNLITSRPQLINVFFEHILISNDKDGLCVFRSSREASEISKSYDLVIGADGAYSAVRENLLRLGRVSFSRQYIDHGYKELSIPPRYNSLGEEEYALKRVEGLHIWPRGKFMLIALPNPDKSFTATLFAPYSGTGESPQNHLYRSTFSSYSQHKMDSTAWTRTMRRVWWLTSSDTSLTCCR